MDQFDEYAKSVVVKKPREVDPFEAYAQENSYSSDPLIAELERLSGRKATNPALETGSRQLQIQRPDGGYDVENVPLYPVDTTPIVPTDETGKELTLRDFQQRNLPTPEPRSAPGEFAAAAVRSLLDTAEGIVYTTEAFTRGINEANRSDRVFPFGPQPSRDDTVGTIANVAGGFAGALTTGPVGFGATTFSDVGQRTGDLAYAGGAAIISAGLGVVPVTKVVSKVPGLDKALTRLGSSETQRLLTKRTFDALVSGVINVGQTASAEYIARAGGAEPRKIDYITEFLGGAIGQAAFDVPSFLKDRGAIRAFENARSEALSQKFITKAEADLINTRPGLLAEVVLRRAQNERVDLVPLKDKDGRVVVDAYGHTKVEVKSEKDLVTWTEKRALEHNEAAIDAYRESLKKGADRLFVDTPRTPPKLDEVSTLRKQINTKAEELAKTIRPEDLTKGGLPVTERALALRDLLLVKESLKNSTVEVSRLDYDRAVALLDLTKDPSKLTKPILEELSVATATRKEILSPINLRPDTRPSFPLVAVKKLGYLKDPSTLASSPRVQGQVRRAQRGLVERLQTLRSARGLDTNQKFVLAKTLEADFVSRVETLLKKDNDNVRGARERVTKAVRDTKGLEGKLQTQVLMALDNAIDMVSSKALHETQRGTVERLIEDFSDPKYGEVGERALGVLEDLHRRMVSEENFLPWGERVAKVQDDLTRVIKDITAVEITQARSSLYKLLTRLPDDIRSKFLSEELKVDRLAEAKSPTELKVLGEEINKEIHKWQIDAEIEKVLTLVSADALKLNPRRDGVFGILRKFFKAPEAQPQRTIRGVAIQYDDKIYEGKPSESHADLYERLKKEIDPKKLKDFTSKFLTDSLSGFVDNDGKFLGRQDAAQVGQDVTTELNSSVIADEVTKLVKGGIDPRAIDVLRGNLYSGDLSTIVVKELLQNSIDATRANEGTRSIRVNVDAPARTIVVEDNGTGMSPATVQKELIEIGGTLKPEGSSGGFGLAKVAIIANSEVFDVETVALVNGKKIWTTLSGSGKDWFGEGLTTTSKEVSIDTPTGTKITSKILPDIEISTWQVETYLQNFKSSIKLKGTFDFKLNNRSLENRDWRTKEKIAESNPSEKLGTLKVTGSDIDVYVSPGVETQYGLQYMVLNNGLPQFSTDVRLPKEDGMKLPIKVLVDVRATVSPEHLDYPFDASREKLKTTTADAVKDFIFKEIVEKALKKERDRFGSLFKDAAKIKNGVVNTTTEPFSGRVIDSTGGTNKDYVNELANRDYTSKIDAALYRTFFEVMKILTKVDPKFSDTKYGSLMIGGDPGKFIFGYSIRSEVVGGKKGQQIVSIDPWTIYSYFANEKGKFLDPRELAQEVYATLVHEFSHTLEFSHNANFARALTKSIGPLVDAGPKMVSILEKTFTEAYADAKFQNDATDARRVPGEDLLGTISSESSAGTPGQTPVGAQGNPGLGQGASAGSPNAVPTSPQSGQATRGNVSNAGASAQPADVFYTDKSTGDVKVDSRVVRSRLEGISNLDATTSLRNELAREVRRGAIERGLYRQWGVYSKNHDEESLVKALNSRKDLSKTREALDPIVANIKLVLDPVTFEGMLYSIAKGDTENALYKVFHKDLQDPMSRHTQNVANIARFVSDTTKSVYGFESETVAQKRRFADFMAQEIAPGITRDRAMYIYALSTDEGRVEDLLKHGATVKGKPIDVPTALASLSDKDRVFVDKIKSHFQNNPVVEKAFTNFQLLNGYTPQRKRGYMPSSRSPEATKIDPDFGTFTTTLIKDIDTLKDRQENVGRPFQLDRGFMSSFMGASERLSLFAEAAQPLYRAQNALISDDVKSTMTSKFGKAMYEDLKKYLANIYGQVGHQSTFIDQAINHFTASYSISKTGLNLFSAAKQSLYISTLIADGTLRPSDVLKAIGEGSWLSRGVSERMQKNSGLAYQRYHGQFLRDMMVMTDDDRPPSRLSVAQHHAMVLQRTIDRATMQIAWRASELTAKRQGFQGDALTRETVRLFEIAAGRDQPTSNPLYATSLEIEAKRQPLLRASLTFQKETNRLYNVVRRHVVHAAQNPSLSNIENATRALMFGVIGNTLGSSLINALRREAFAQPQDETDVGVDVVGNLAGMYYLATPVETLADAIIKQRNPDYRGFLGPIGGLGFDMASIGYSTVQALTSGDETVESGPRRGMLKSDRELGKIIDRSTSLIGGTLGLPLWGLWNYYKGLYRWTDDQLRLMTYVEHERQTLKSQGLEGSSRYAEIEKTTERINFIHRQREAGKVSEDSARRAIEAELRRVER